MAAIIIFGNLSGLLLKEWKLVDSRTRFCLWLGIVMLVVSVMMIGVGDGLAQRHAVAVCGFDDRGAMYGLYNL
ncbi:MAG TPA: hypothetical protein PKY77_23120, partial [Phycisphaerae bacterium]|nr:hypothetical protein [Phycisphaerae bacterium]HRY71302.1 hypothetical protein [Phycisphaerae bacterium]